MGKLIKVLIVDDSVVMRKLLKDILESDPEIQVIGTVKNGIVALEQIPILKPDVVTLDIEMPKMDGLTALQHIMDQHPVPVLMISAMNTRQADITLKALDFGAVDFFPKTSGTLSLDIEKAGFDLIEKVKLAATIKVSRIKKSQIFSAPHKRFLPTNEDLIVAIGASTGGPKAIPEILSRLPRNLPAAILIVQHMPEGFTRSFAERLNWYTSIEVKEAADGDLITKGIAYIAPGNKHMSIHKDKIEISDGPKINNVRPSVDVLMLSAAENYGPNCLGVILTGMGSDGAAGMKEIKNQGGYNIAQDKESCIVYGMSKTAIELQVVDKIASLDRIADDIMVYLEKIIKR
jgi:two-component system chemotaxis response regulator CheB